VKTHGKVTKQREQNDTASVKYLRSEFVAFSLYPVPNEKLKFALCTKENVLSNTFKQDPVHHLWPDICGAVPCLCSIHGAIGLHESGDVGVSFGLDVGLGDLFPGDDGHLWADKLVFL